MSGFLESDRAKTVFLGRILLHLGAQDFQRARQPRPGFSRLDHFVNLPHVSRSVGVEELIAVLGHQLFLARHWIVRIPDFVTK
jgi:hypothetical protein